MHHLCTNYLVVEYGLNENYSLAACLLMLFPFENWAAQ